MTKPPFGGSVAPVVVGKPTSIGESYPRLVWIKGNDVKYFLDATQCFWMPLDFKCMFGN